MRTVYGPAILLRKDKAAPAAKVDAAAAKGGGAAEETGGVPGQEAAAQRRSRGRRAVLGSGVPSAAVPTPKKRLLGA